MSGLKKLRIDFQVKLGTKASDQWIPCHWIQSKIFNTTLINPCFFVLLSHVYTSNHYRMLLYHYSVLQDSILSELISLYSTPFGCFQFLGSAGQNPKLILTLRLYWMVFRPFSEACPKPDLKPEQFVNKRWSTLIMLMLHTPFPLWTLSHGSPNSCDGAFHITARPIECNIGWRWAIMKPAITSRNSTKNSGAHFDQPQNQLSVCKAEDVFEISHRDFWW